MIKIYNPVAAAVPTTTTTVPAAGIMTSSDIPLRKGKTAAEYVLELKLDTSEEDDDDGMLEEITEEMEKASTAWRKVMGGALTATSPTATMKCSASMLCALVEALGTTYDEELHGGALRKIASAHTTPITNTIVVTDNTTTGSDVMCELTEELFVDWYVRLLYDEDDDLVVCTGTVPSANSTFLAASAGGDGWKCSVCLVSNKDKGQAKCACCDAPNPSHVPATVTTGHTVQPSITDKGFTFGMGFSSSTTSTTTTTGTSSIGTTGFVFGSPTTASTPPQTAGFASTITPTSADTVRSLFGQTSTAQSTQTTAIATTTIASPFTFGKVTMIGSDVATTAGFTTTTTSTTTTSTTAEVTPFGFPATIRFGSPGVSSTTPTPTPPTATWGGMFGTTPAVTTTTGLFGTTSLSSSSPQPPVPPNPPSIFGSPPTNTFGITPAFGSGNGLGTVGAFESLPTASGTSFSPFAFAGISSSCPFKLSEFQGFGSVPVTTIPLSSAHLSFQTAVKEGNLDKVQEVHANVGKEIDVNFKDPNNGRTFLHWAAFYGHTLIAAFLIELGAMKDIEGLGGATPLHLAAQEGRIEMVTLLLVEGVDKDKVNTAGATALSLAARQGHLGVVQCLLDNGVAKDKTNMSSGDSPLHLATEQGHFDVVTCLIDNGAQKDICNRMGKTPITRAFRYSHDSIVEYFKTLGLFVPTKSVRLTLPGLTSGGQKCIYPTAKMYDTNLATGFLRDNDVVEVFDETISSMYKLVDGRGYTLVANKGCIWTPTQPTNSPPFTLDSLPSLQFGVIPSGQSIRIQLMRTSAQEGHCIRSAPSLYDKQVGTILNGAIVEVDPTLVNGFYRLIDGQGYTLASGAGFTWTKL